MRYDQGRNEGQESISILLQLNHFDCNYFNFPLAPVIGYQNDISR